MTALLKKGVSLPEIGVTNIFFVTPNFNRLYLRRYLELEAIKNTNEVYVSTLAGINSFGIVLHELVNIPDTFQTSLNVFRRLKILFLRIPEPQNKLNPYFRK